MEIVLPYLEQQLSVHILASKSSGACCLVCVNHLQQAFSLLFSWVIGYAAHGTRDLQAATEEG